MVHVAVLIAVSVPNNIKFSSGTTKLEIGFGAIKLRIYERKLPDH